MFDKYEKIGFFFLFVQFLVFIGNYGTENLSVFLWFCNHVPILFSIAFFMKNTQLIKALINVGFFGQLVWAIDFLGKIIFDLHIFNITAYVFDSTNNLQILIVILIHLFSTILAMFFTYKKEIKLKSLLYSAVYLIIIYVISIWLTTFQENVNWIYMIEGGINYSSELYVLFWPLIAFLFVVVPTYYIQKRLYFLSLKKF